MSLESDAIEVLGASPLGRAPHIENPTPIRLDNTVTKSQYSKHKVIVSGKSIDIYTFEVPVRLGKTKSKTKSQPKSKIRSDEYKQRSIIRAKNNIRRLCLCNYVKYDKFITLTLNNNQNFDIKSLTSCLVYFKKFIRKLKSHYPTLKYIAVPEFQEREVVHYHLICNLPYIENIILEKMWGHGITKILSIYDEEGVAVYLSKYLSKRFDDPRKNGHRLYYSSKNLTRSKTYYGKVAEKLAGSIVWSKKYKENYSRSYDTARNGQVIFKQYNPKPNDRT